MIEAPDADRLAALNDAELSDFPRMALIERGFDHPRIDDVAAATRAALDDVSNLESLPDGAEVGITAGSRGIHDMPEMLRAIVDEMDARGFEPFVFPAMGSHGGATAAGQREALASLGVTEASMGCEIRSSMDVTAVAEDSAGRPVFAAHDAVAADAVLLVNRVKAHTDFSGRYESGLCKMAVIGLGKQRGAELAHNVALPTSFREVIPERAALLFEHVPVVGGVALVENAHDRAAHVEGLDVEEIPDREPELLERSKELLPTLPVDDLDLLVLDAIGKDVSGTGMDTNVVGRIRMHGEPEIDTPAVTRIHVRSITDASHGNGIGLGLADFAHRRAVERLDLTDTYVNAVTSGEPGRANVPLVVPSDEIALMLAVSTTGVADPDELRVIRVPNTLDLGRMVVSEPVLAEIEHREEISVLSEFDLTVENDDLPEEPYG